MEDVGIFLTFRRMRSCAIVILADFLFISSLDEATNSQFTKRNLSGVKGIFLLRVTRYTLLADVFLFFFPTAVGIVLKIFKGTLVL